MKKCLSIFFALICTITLAQICGNTATGLVLDFHTGEPIPNAIVENSVTQKQYFTNDEGEFIINNLCDKDYEITISHEACETTSLIFNPVINKELTVFLEHHIIDLEKIEVSGQQHQDVTSVQEIHIHDIELEQGSAEAIGEVLKNISGVDALSTGNHIVKPIIHGLHSSRVVTLNNGIRQEDMEWGVEHSPNIDVNQFNDIKVIKGGAALRYGGDAIGGMVLTEYPKIPSQDTLLGKVILTGLTNGEGGNAAIRIQKGFKNKWGIQLQGSYKKLGDLSTPDYLLTNTGNQQKSAMVELKWGDFKRNITTAYSFFEQDLGILKATHVGNLRDLYMAMNATKPTPIEDFSYNIQKPYQNIQHHLGKIKIENRFKSLGKLEATYAIQSNQRKEYDLRLGEKREIPAMDIRLTTHSTELSFTYDKLKEWEIVSGITGFYQDNFTNPETGVKRLIPDYQRLNVGYFLTTQYKINPNWEIDAAARYDYNQIDTKKYYDKSYWQSMNYDTYFPENIIGEYDNEWLTQFNLKYHTIAASFGTNYQPNNFSKLYLNYALNNRSPNPAELFSEGLHHSAVSIEMGDVRIQPETSHKIGLGWDKKWNLLNGLGIQFLTYYNHIQDYIYLIPTGARYTIRGAFPVWSYQQTDAQLVGFDFDTDIQINSLLNWENQISYVHGTDVKNDLPLIQMPPFQWKQKISFENQKNQWKPHFSINTHYTAQQNRYPDYDFDINFIENGEIVDRTLDISSTPKAYFLVGIKSGIHVPNQLIDTQINFSINNIFNTQYRNYLNRFRYYADELGRQIQLQIIINF